MSRVGNNNLQNVNDDNLPKNDKFKKRHYYTTTSSKYSKIINAKTGVPYYFNFNSLESKKIYHVIDATAKYDKNGFIKNRKLCYFNEPNHLFYDSPEQYKLHHGSNMKTETILEWHKRQQSSNVNINCDIDTHSLIEETVLVEVK
jgi:hypothetical protein